MSKDKQRPGYLGASIPEKQKPKKSSRPVYSSEDSSLLAARLDELNEALTKQNRDRLDAEYNVGWDNLDEGLQSLLSEYESDLVTARADIQTWADEVSAGFEAIAEWQDETEDAIARIAGEVGEGYATVEMIASVTDANGNVTAASIAAAVNDSGSSVMIEADKIQMTGTTTFLTGSDVGDNGSAVIAGNRISLNLDGSDDDGYHTLTSDNGVNFDYIDGAPGHGTQSFASIYTSVDGNDSDNSSRYALCIDANAFFNPNNDRAYASLKLTAQGRVSVSGYDGIYLESYAGYITADAGDNTRIRANKSFYQMTATPSNNDWSFCTDGIYHGTTRVLAV